MRLGPDTTTTVIDLSYRHFSGYNYMDDKIRGFSHTHLVGAGVDDLGTFGVMPFNAGPLRGGRPEVHGWWATLDKETETASPGYYKVHLNEPNVDAELLAVGTHAAVHRYTYKSYPETSRSSTSAGIIFDVCHAAKLKLGEDQPCKNATIEFDEDQTTFRASVQFAGGLSGTTWYYFYGEVRPSSGRMTMIHWETCVDKKILGACSAKTSATSESGTLFSVGNFVHMTRDLNDFQLEIRVGLSHLSFAQAKLNLEDAIPNKLMSFDALKTRTEDVWCSHLKDVEVTAQENDADLLKILYSSWYRTFIGVTDYTEVGGLYLGVDGAVHNATTERATKYASSRTSLAPSSYTSRFFSDFSLWDTFRTLQPWYLLTNEDLAIGLIRSMVDITVQQQAFPRWTLGHHEASCMMGESGVSFLLDAALAGFQDEFDLATVQRILNLQSTQPWPVNARTDVEHYLAEGFVSQETSDVASTLTLTFAYDDYLLGKISELVNDTATATAALQRSTNYRTIWSSEKQFFCPRYSNGDLKCAETGMSPEAWQTYKEGDAYHWAWFVPHDVDGLKALYPSPEAFDANLQAFFVNHVAYHEKFGSPVPNPYFWAGNEHDFLAPFMFNFGPDCTKTQYWARQLTKMHFSAKASGIPGNDDYGSMATWVLFTSLGLFPQAGLNRFLIASPRIQSATISLRKLSSSIPSKLVIQTVNNSDENVFVEKLLVNGREWTSPFIDRSVLTSRPTVTLEFHMSSTQASGLCPK